VFRGSWIQSLFDDPGTVNTVVTPPYPSTFGPVPPYQVLRNPFEVQPDGPNPNAKLWDDSYGWQVFALGDVGSAGGGALDGIDDIAIHAETTDWMGHSHDLGLPDIVEVGALFIYFGTGQADGQDIVVPEHVLVQRPGNVGPPQHGTRFGRAAAGIDYYNTLTSTVERGLLVGDQDAAVDSPQGPLPLAGMVELLRTPLCPSAPVGTCQASTWYPSLQPVMAMNAWDGPLLDPQGPAAGNVFGGWLLVLNYLGVNEALFGQQFIATARGSAVQGTAEAGRAESFYAPGAGP
jgi:hypothetical protein